MKTTVVVSLLSLMVFAGLANAQQIQGQLQLYADETGVDCIIQDMPGLVKVYVYYFDYYSDEGVRAVQFGAPVPSCWTGAIWLEDTTPWLDLGDSQLNDSGGWMIAFGGCQIPPLLVGTIWYFAQGLAQTCCPYPVVKAPDDAHPEIPTPLGVDCSPNPRLIGINPGTSYINGDQTCPCIWPVPVQEKTWGA